MPQRSHVHNSERSAVGRQQNERARRARYEKANGNARERGYNSKWERERAAYLAENPLCCTCLAMGKTTAATIVDHITPHKGNSKLFWQRSNWQPLCAPHHNRKTASERGGFGRSAPLP